MADEVEANNQRKRKTPNPIDLPPKSPRIIAGLNEGYILPSRTRIGAATPATPPVERKKLIPKSPRTPKKQFPLNKSLNRMTNQWWM